MSSLSSAIHLQSLGLVKHFFATQIKTNMQQNLSVVTLLAPTLGYDVATQIVHEANNNNISLGQAAQKLGLYGCDEFDALLSEYFKKNN